MEAGPGRAVLEVRGIGKRFPGVRALHDVSLRVEAGEVLAVLGENGAGKSTLMKILAGVQAADEGEIRMEGRLLEMGSVQDALRHGIALIHQELNLATNLSVGANLFLGREPRRRGLIDEAEVERESAKFLARVGLRVDPGETLGELSLGRQQLVEITKALTTRARVLIMDEPTSSLSQGEAETLFEVIRDLKRSGVSVIYISHRLSEVKALADRVMVLRDGENVGELKREAIDHEAMVRMMVGREIAQFYPRQAHAPGAVALEVRGLRTRAHPGSAVDLAVREGEIVGLAGLVGAGRTELVATLFGVTPPVAGEVRVGGVAVSLTTPGDAIRAGLALVPEDRKGQGLVLDMGVRENLSLANLERATRGSVFVDETAERALSGRMIGLLGIKTPDDEQLVRFLSGGNQQKVVLGKWLALEPRVLLLDEPTRGIDIGAKQEIYGLMEELAGRGVAILFVSSELEEVMGMADRALVMHEGRITGELKREDLTEEAIMRLATGHGAAEAA